MNKMFFGVTCVNDFSSAIFPIKLDILAPPTDIFKQ